MLTIVGCMICRLKPDSQFATQYRASVHRMRESTHRGGGGGRGGGARNKSLDSHLPGDDVCIDPNPMFKTAVDLSTLMNSHSNDAGLGHLARQPTRRFIADMAFGTAPTFDQIRPTMQMYQKIPSESGGKNAEAVALWNFVGQQPGDLSFNAGDRIELLQHAKKWWEGRCNGRVGVFPSNYVQLTRASTSWAGMAKPEAMAPPNKAMMRMSIRDGPQVPYSMRPQPAVARTATALFDFVGEQPGDLSFTRGEVIDLITWDDTWWEGFVGDRVGCL